MPQVKVEIDISGYVEQVTEARAREIPFVTAKALTRTAQDGQIEMRRVVRERFTLRNDWTQRGIKITPAQKLSWPIESEVYTDTGSAKAPDYLEAQEDGGLKVPHNGHKYIAIPTRILREIVGPSRVIPDPLRPVSLLAGSDGSSYISRKRDRLGGYRQLRTPKALQWVGFKEEYKGDLYIFARRPGGAHGVIYPFYILLPETHVRAILDMEQTVAKVAAERFEQHWDDAWAELGG